MTYACVVNVQIAAAFEAQTVSAVCVSAPLIVSGLNRMASRRGPSQAIEDDRIIKEKNGGIKRKTAGHRRT